ncbi:Hypothetical predicted protein [Cloeon dipterum]|uniref:Uncharacterized protein n=1 Tax=Cloeon dipterum TaxID=197152 RepID=A0A8S1DYJ5_9INSE|nr:Hypothetical predicted protein [Cloeon dipterum]
MDIVTCCGKFVRWYTSNSLFMAQVGHVIQVKSLFPCVAKPPEHPDGRASLAAVILRTTHHRPRHARDLNEENASGWSCKKRQRFPKDRLSAQILDCAFLRSVFAATG